MAKIKGIPMKMGGMMGGLATGTDTIVKKVGNPLSKHVVGTPSKGTPGKAVAGKSPSSIGFGGGKSFWSKHSVSGDGMAKASKFPLAKTGSVTKPYPVGKDSTDVASKGKGKPSNSLHAKQQ